MQEYAIRWHGACYSFRESRLAPGGFSENQDSVSLFSRHVGGRPRLNLLGQLAQAQTAPSSPTDQSAPSTPSDQQAQPAPTPDTPPTQQTQQPTPTPSPDTQAPAQQPPAAQTPDQTQAPSDSAPNAATPSAADGQTFSGTVVKSGDKYMLKTDSGKTYDIDHQDEVKKFDGKRVRVKGKLDDTGTKIQVQ